MALSELKLPIRVINGIMGKQFVTDKLQKRGLYHSHAAFPEAKIIHDIRMARSYSWTEFNNTLSQIEDISYDLLM